MRKKTIKDIPSLNNRTVFLTVDFNICLKNGQITNDTRIIETLPTVKYLLKKGARVILASHLGRPRGHVDPKLSLKPVARRLEKLLLKKVHLIKSFWDKKARKEVSHVPKDALVMLENIRFHKGEEENDQEFARHLAEMADFFANDAFGASHRIHTSIVGIAQFLPAYAGLLMAKEIKMISRALEEPKRPFLVIIGGAKTLEKISVIEKLLDKADTVALGGAIANTFLAAWGFGMGRSMVDYEMIEMARVVFWKTTKKHSALMLPLDVVISGKDKGSLSKEVDYNKVPFHVAIYDIGSKTREHYQNLIREAKTVIWNGPMGLYEDRRFRKGTNAILETIADSDAFSIIGGGDTLTTLDKKEYLKKIGHISTGGSAMLEFMKKGTLPGIEVLLDK